MIEVKNLTKRYGQFIALDAISFSAGEAEIVGFLGPNGAGKTTTMRILTGYMPPSEGTARVAGFDVVEDSLEMRRESSRLCAISASACPRTTHRGFRNPIWRLCTSSVNCWRRNSREGENARQAQD